MPVTEVEYNRAHLRFEAAILRNGPNEISLSFRTGIAPAGASVIRFTDETDRNDYLYTLLVPSDAQRESVFITDPFLRAMVWGSLWDLVRDARVVPELYEFRALDALAAERDEQIAARLMARVIRVVESYAAAPRLGQQS